MYLSACTPTSTTANGYVVLTFTGAGNCLWTTPPGVTLLLDFLNRNRIEKTIYTEPSGNNFTLLNTNKF
jgi:hypothetical protein